MRTTCLYCEREGVETALIRVGHWGYCPIHSAARLAALTPRTESAKELMDKAEAERRRG